MFDSDITDDMSLMNAESADNVGEGGSDARSDEPLAKFDRMVAWANAQAADLAR